MTLKGEAFLFDVNPVRLLTTVIMTSPFTDKYLLPYWIEHRQRQPEQRHEQPCLFFSESDLIIIHDGQDYALHDPRILDVQIIPEDDILPDPDGSIQVGDGLPTPFQTECHVVIEATKWALSSTLTPIFTSRPTPSFMTLDVGTVYCPYQPT